LCLRGVLYGEPYLDFYL